MTGRCLRTELATCIQQHYSPYRPSWFRRV